MGRVLSREEYRKRKKMMRYARFGIVVAAIMAALLLIILLLVNIFSLFKGKGPDIDSLFGKQLTITGDLLNKSEYSRPGISMEEVKGIVIHYTGMTGGTAKARRDYFNTLNSGSPAAQSSHFVVGLEGEVIQCIPTAEVAYASLSRNKDTISIEYCHSTADGKLNSDEAEYRSLVVLTAWMMAKYNLTTKDIVRHYDINGTASCPKYFAEDSDAWNKFISDVSAMKDTVLGKKEA